MIKDSLFDSASVAIVLEIKSRVFNITWLSSIV